eukprot:7726949-Pyramimonas_sp.AAC.1
MSSTSRGAGRVIRNISDVGRVLTEDLQSLAAPATDGCCMRCGCQLHGCLQSPSSAQSQVLAPSRKATSIRLWPPLDPGVAPGGPCPGDLEESRSS